MAANNPSAPDFDWRVTSFEGSRREQLRRWAQLPLERIVLAIEEMQDLAHAFGAASLNQHTGPVSEPEEKNNSERQG